MKSILQSNYPPSTAPSYPADPPLSDAALLDIQTTAVREQREKDAIEASTKRERKALTPDDLAPYVREGELKRANEKGSRQPMSGIKLAKLGEAARKKGCPLVQAEIDAVLAAAEKPTEEEIASEAQEIIS